LRCARHAAVAVAAHGVGGQVEDVAVAAGAEHHHVGHVRLILPVTKVTRDDAACLAVHDHQVEHLAAVVHLHGAGLDLLLERRIGTEEELLPSLAARVERARDLRATEGAVGEEAAVLAREGHAGRHALVDDVHAQLGQAVDVGLTGAEVAALHRVVEQAVDAVAVVLVVLGGVDAALGRDGVRATRAVLEAEAL
jgi:hypothetical protein